MLAARRLAASHHSYGRAIFQRQRLCRQARGVDVAASVSTAPAPHKRVIFVMGGPGSGKGTQCDRLERDYDIAFFSAGELLRQVIRSNTDQGRQLQAIILDGRIVPSQVTVSLLQQAIHSSPKSTVLIDGFPRNMENWEVWQQLVGCDCDMALFFDCPEEVMTQRLLARNSGREDDNEDTIRKRVQGFSSQTLPVVDVYRRAGTLHTVNTDRPVDAIYSELTRLVGHALPTRQMPVHA